MGYENKSWTKKVQLLVSIWVFYINIRGRLDDLKMWEGCDHPGSVLRDACVKDKKINENMENVYPYTRDK